MTVQVQPLLHSTRPTKLPYEVGNHAAQARAKRPYPARAKRHISAGQVACDAGQAVLGKIQAMPKTAYLSGPGSAEWKAEVGRRFAWARDLVSVSQTAAAKDLGTDQSTLSKIEDGERMVPIKIAMAACKKWGLSLDYIYRGMIGGHLRRDVEVRLVAAHPELVEADQPEDTPRRAKAKVPAA